MTDYTPSINVVIPPFPTFPPIVIPPPGSVSTGTVSGTSGTYVSSSTNGYGPECKDAGWNNQKAIGSLSGSVTGPLDGTANLATMAAYSVKAPKLSDYTSKQALALAVGAPIKEDVEAALNPTTGSSALAAKLTSKAFYNTGSCYNYLIGELGGRYNIGGRRTETVNAQVAISLQRPAGPTFGKTWLGFYNFPASGSFSSLTVTVTRDNLTKYTKTFTNYSLMKTTLLSTVVDLGDLSAMPVNTATSIKVSVTEVLANSSQGAFFNVFLADPIEEAQGNAAFSNAALVGGDHDRGVPAPASTASPAVADLIPGFVVLGCVILTVVLRLATRTPRRA